MREKLREYVIESQLSVMCERNRWLCYKTVSPSSNGFPDRTIITDYGRVVFCEVKRPGEKPRKLQQKLLQKLKKQNADVCVVSTFEQVDILEHILLNNTKLEIEDETSFYVKPE